MYKQALDLDPKNEELAFEAEKRIKKPSQDKKRISGQISLLSKIVYGFFVVIAIIILLSALIISDDMPDYYALLGYTRGKLILVGFFGAVVCVFVGWVLSILIGGFAVVVRNSEEQLDDRGINVK
jgi:hypothetical protein